MKSITKIVMFLMMITTPWVLANDIYVTQSGATLTLDVLQDGQNNTIGNSTQKQKSSNNKLRDFTPVEDNLMA